MMISTVYSSYIRSVLCIAACAGLFLGCSDKVAGTVDDTDTQGGKAMLVLGDGSPASGALVRAIDPADGSIDAECFADSAGSYHIDGVRGLFNIWAQKDSLVFFQDSLFVDEGYERRDTLDAPGIYRGTVIMNTGDDPREVTVEVLGTPIHLNVESDGSFAIGSLPPGLYRIGLLTTLPDYVPTYRIVTVVPQPQDQGLLSDSITMTFTGIPPVTGLAAVYDSIAGVVHLSWDSMAVRNFEDYVISRQDDSVKTVDLTPYALSGTNSYDDTIAPWNTPDIPATFKYRVRIRNLFGEEGKNWGYLRVPVVCPVEIASNVFATTDSFALGDSSFFLRRVSDADFDTITRGALSTVAVGTVLQISASVQINRVGMLSVSWRNGDAGALVRTVPVVGRVLSFNDVLTWTVSGTGRQDIVLEITDAYGTVHRERYCFWGI